MPGYRALTTFESFFSGRPYLHRISNHGDRFCIELFEDLYNIRSDTKFRRSIDTGLKGLSPKNLRVGIQNRRSDGLFGDLIPHRSRTAEGYHVPRGEVATTNIGVEAKILFKSMRKQISDRAQGLRDAAKSFSVGADGRKRGNPIGVAVIAVNHAPYTVGFEGERSYRTTGTAKFPHPSSEVSEINRKIELEIKPHFDETIILGYIAKNEPPYTFEWVNPLAVETTYAAALLRILSEFETRF